MRMRARGGHAAGRDKAGRAGAALGHGLAPFLAALVVIGLQVWTKPLKAPQEDEFRYLATMTALVESGVHGDRAADAERGERAPPPGRSGAPAYPMFATLMARLDSGLAAIIRCYGRPGWERRSCPERGSFASLVAVQTVLAALSAVLVFWLARTLSGSILVAWLAMVITLAAGELGYYARTYLTENMSLLAMHGFLAFAAAGIVAERGRARGWLLAGAGVLLALAALSRPAYLYLFPVMVVLLPAALAWSGRARGQAAWIATAVFCLAFLASLAPWALRNLALFGDPALTRGYAGSILVQRVAYNMMSWAEWAVAFIYWLPDFGDRLAALLFAPELYERLGWQHPQNYYLVGNGPFFAEALRAAGGQDRLFAHVLETYVLGDLLKHVMVTIPLSLRGLWAGKYLALAGVALLWPVGRDLARRGRLAPFLVALLAPLFMVGFHGFVSVSIPRYNLAMIALFAFVLAYALADVIRRFPVAAWRSSGRSLDG